jgi:hypothetical protein
MLLGPRGVKVVAVSTTTRPVTQTARVAVKTAASPESEPGGVVARGSMSNKLPNVISIAKLNLRCGKVFIPVFQRV